MGQSEDSFFQRELERASADEAEAIVFLASIIPKRSRDRIRVETLNSRPAGMNGFLFGMRIRNLLRTGGFQYGIDMMESIWFSWLRKAVNLPEDRIVLTDSIGKRIRKYKSIFRKPPLRPPLDPGDVENAKQLVEKRLSIKLPEIDVRYSDNIDSAMCLSASEPKPKTQSTEENTVSESTKALLRLRGLKENELDGIYSWKSTIFLQKRYRNYPASVYGDLYHELGHAAAHVLKVKDKEWEESFALAYCLIGLLLEANAGRFTLRKAFDQIELSIESVRKAVPLPFVRDPHPWSIRPIAAINPGLKYRDRDPDEILAELDRTIKSIVDTDEELFQIAQSRKLENYEIPFVIVSGTIAIVLFAIPLVLSFLHMI